MTSSRLVLGFGLALALTIALMLVLSSDEAEPEVPVSTTAQAAPSTAAPTTTPTTAERSATATKTVEQREEEVAAILQELYFGWFEAIYRKDPEALDNVVATEEMRAAAVEAMPSAEFERPPTLESVVVGIDGILLDRPDCLVVARTLDLSTFRGAGSTSTAVSVLWPERDGWRLVNTWSSQNDLWLPDCDLRNRSTEP